MIKSVSIQFDKESKKPLYLQLSEHIAEMISQGAILTGEKLPAIRAMSNRLAVNTVTVVSAYKKLCAEGYIEAKQGSGFYVRKPAQRFLTSESAVPDEIYNTEDVQLLYKGSILYGAQPVNMASTSPSLDVLSFDEVKQSLFSTVEADGLDAFDYQDPLGFTLLRQEIAAQLRSEGVLVNTENIHIVSGAQQGLDITAKALLSPNDTIIVETPVYSGVLAVFKSRGARIEQLQIEQDGTDMEKLAQLFRRYKPKLIYTIPAYHNPTGYVYSIGKKQELIRLANAFGCYIFEDDYLREMTYEGMPPCSLKSLDTCNRVILVKSYSKLLLPGLRIAFMVVPDELSAQFALAKHTTDIFTSGIIQRTFYRYLSSGSWKKHLDEIVPFYKKRYKYMLESMKRMLPDDVTFVASGGGLSFWVKLPAYADLNALYYMANAKGLSFVPGNVFSSVRYPVNNHIRLSFAKANEEELSKGLYILAGCLKELKRGARS